MSTPLAKSSGAITTTGVAISTGSGVLTYAHGSSAGAISFYDGASSTGTLLAYANQGTRAIIVTPVQFNGLWAVPQSTVGSSAGALYGAHCHYA